MEFRHWLCAQEVNVFAGKMPEFKGVQINISVYGGGGGGG